MSRSLLVAVLVIATSSSCASPRAREPLEAPAVAQVSRPGLASYERAHGWWSTTLSAGVAGEKLATALELVAEELEKASVNDPDWPAPRSRRGSIALELACLARDDAVRAKWLEAGRYELASAVAACPEWLPGWLAQAELWSACGRDAEARNSLKQAKNALARLEELADKALTASGEEDVCGASLTKAGEPPRRAPNERVRELVGWLERDLAWRIDAPKIASADGASTGMLQRLRARLELQRVRAEIAATAEIDPREIARRLQRVLAWDADLGEARIELATWLARAGEHAKALAFVEPYLTGSFPLLTENPRLLRFAGDCHAALASDRAATYYARILRAHPDDTAARAALARSDTAGEATP